MDQQAVTFLVGMAMLAGLAGALIPWFPDILLIWGAGLVYGILVGWGTWGPWLFALMTVAALVGFVAEVAVSVAGARVGGASGWGILAGLMLAVVGMIVFSPLGALIGLALGMLLVEGWRQRNLRKAAAATLGAVVGWGASLLVKFSLSLWMVLLWGAWVTLG
ncbi:MAG: putative membrane protein [Anaerolineales bacterium]|nr:putative membrane protein [Anaerolineales bacterium]